MWLRFNILSYLHLSSLVESYISLFNWIISFIQLFFTKCSVYLVYGHLLNPSFYEIMLDVLRCNIPVIVMGETGCGKTRLIKFLCALQCPPGVVINNMVVIKVWRLYFLIKIDHIHKNFLPHFCFYLLISTLYIMMLSYVMNWYISDCYNHKWILFCSFYVTFLANFHLSMT